MPNGHKIISIINQKGGVGKTTTAVNLGAGLKNMNKKVLLVDLDSQANLTASLGQKDSDREFTVFDILKAEASFHEVAVRHEGLTLLPASAALSGADVELGNVVGRELLLKEALEGVQESFDFILIDCPPTLGLLTLMALTASDSIIIPMQAEYLPLEGLSFLMETVNVVKKRLNKALEITGVVITMYDSRQKLQREVIDIIHSHFGEKLFNTYIRNNVALAEAPSFGQDIFTYKPDSTGAADYKNFCKEVIEREVI